MTLPITIASIPYLESQMETKYESHEFLDIKEIKEEPADYQQSPNYHINMTLPGTTASTPYLESQIETKYDIPEYFDIKEIKEESADYQQSELKVENIIVDVSPSEHQNLDYSQIKCCDYDSDEVTDINSLVMVIQNDDFEHSTHKKDQPSNLISHMKRKTETNKSTTLSCSKNHHHKPSILKLLQAREKMYKCGYCDYGSLQKVHLKRHINSIHTREEIHKCQYCDYGSPQMSNLKTHVNSKHTREKIHKCNYCDYEIPEKSKLKRHINSKHTREEIHKCQYCDYGSPRLDNLKFHINSKHTREKLHRCEYCDYETPCMTYLKRHTNSKHKKEDTQVSVLR